MISIVSSQNTVIFTIFSMVIYHCNGVIYWLMICSSLSFELYSNFLITQSQWFYDCYFVWFMPMLVQWIDLVLSNLI